MTPFGIGLIGLGCWGKRYWETLQMLSHTVPLTIFATDRLPSSVFCLPPSASYISYTEMLNRPEVKAVIVATPDETHYEIASQALKSKKDALVEKPMASTVAQAEEMVELAARTGRLLATGHTAVYTTGFSVLRSNLDALRPRLGKIVRLEAFRTSRGRKGGNALWDLAPHDIAMAIILFDEPVDGIVRFLSQSKAVYELVFPLGEFFTSTVEWNSPPFRREFKIVGTKGELSMNTAPPNSEFRATPLARQCEDFIFCCQTRQQPLSDGVLGLKVVRCLEMLGLKYVAFGNCSGL